MVKLNLTTIEVNRKTSEILSIENTSVVDMDYNYMAKNSHKQKETRNKASPLCGCIA